MLQRCKAFCLLFPVVLLLLVSPAAVSQTLFGEVTRVVDGDTVVFKVLKGKTERIRLADIDTLRKISLGEVRPQLRYANGHCPSQLD